MVEDAVAIEVRGFSWKYEGSADWVFQDLSFSVMKGEVLGVVGPSGAGKTTLILSMIGIIPQRVPGRYRGEVLIKGRPFDTTHISRLGQDVGAVFQDPDNQFISMSVIDEMAFGMENIGLSREEMRRRAEEVSRILNLDRVMDRHPHELSGGQKQRVAIASALVLRPDILLLDEPTTDLDPVGRSEVFQTMLKLKKKGQTMVIVEHESDELAKIADRIILLSEGGIKLEDKAREFYSKVDLLKKTGIAPPQSTEIFYEINRKYSAKLPLPLTTEEAKAYLQRVQIRGETRPVRHEGEEAKMDGVAIEVEGVRYTYPDGTEALRGVTLKICEGEYVAFVGQNGSGKTTLAKHFNGLLRPSQGVVKVFGEDTRRREAAELAPLVGYCFQNPDHQLFEATVEKEVAFGPRNIGLPSEEVEAITRRSIRVMGLEGFEKEHPFFLGKGQRLRLAVATILALDSKVMIVDEPTTGQDWRHSKDLMLYLDELNRLGKTVIMITHHMRYVAEHAKRTVVMSEGKVVLDGPTRTVMREVDRLREAKIEPPPVTSLYLSLSLSRDGWVPLTVEEGVDAIGRALVR